MDFQELPNIGPKLAENLRRAGFRSVEEFRAAGAKEAFCRIRAQVDSAACFHQLTALAGAEAGVLKRELPVEKKDPPVGRFDVFQIRPNTRST